MVFILFHKNEFYVVIVIIIIIIIATAFMQIKIGLHTKSHRVSINSAFQPDSFPSNPVRRS